MTAHTHHKGTMRALIETRVFTRFPDDSSRWIFDFRAVSLTRDFATVYAQLFTDYFPEREYQVCGLESAAIPLVTTLVCLAESQKINGLFIRKGRKKSDLSKVIEGTVTNAPVIIVDDVMNSGASVEKQVTVLLEAGLRVEAVFCLVRFYDESHYAFLRDAGIRLVSVFELNDFTQSLSISNKIATAPRAPLPYAHVWGFASAVTTKQYHHVVPHATPVVYKDTVLYATMGGRMYCLDVHTGATRWMHTVLFGDRGKMIFSTPALWNDTVYFGAYDGTFYALDHKTGKKKWTYMDADWIGSSPCISKTNALVYVGLEFGLWKKRGGIVALRADTGAEVWRDTHEGLTHCSPYVSDAHDVLLCGSNDGVLRIYNSQTGALVKTHTLGEPICASFSENAAKTHIAFGAFDKRCHILDLATLEIVDSVVVGEAVYSTPLWIEDVLVFTSLDKCVYAYDTTQKCMLWTFRTRGRVFSSPIRVGTSVYVGSNDGQLYQLDVVTGREVGYIQFTDRLVNACAYDVQNGRFIIPVFNGHLHSIVIHSST
jgi:outer membrane protein assembly factor BamB